MNVTVAGFKNNEATRMIMLLFTRSHTPDSGMLCDNKQKVKCDKCWHKTSGTRDKAELQTLDDRILFGALVLGKTRGQEIRSLEHTLESLIQKQHISSSIIFPNNKPKL